MATSGTDKVTILMVDDQPARLLAYEAILAELGHTLVRASSGVDALARLMERDFALVLLDVSMPGMDGFETASLIHQHPRYEKTPIIFVTGVHVTELDRLKGYKLGAVDYVYIPVVPEILRSKVSVLVELYCKRRELQVLNATLERANFELAEANASLRVSTALKLQEMNRVLENANTELGRTNAALRTEVADRKRAEYALLDADRRKDEFLAMLAHELRNPLAPIRNSVRILQLKGSADTDAVWAHGVIERQVNNLTRLVDDLLDVSRITRGKIKLDRAPVELRSVINGAVETCQPVIDARGHRLAVHAVDEPVWVEGDATRLAQVISNLLSNAAKYTAPNGSIQITLSAEEGAAVVRVKDTGIGIAPEQLPQVFEMFAQLSATPEGSMEGLGIGLALVHRLVEMHGGQVAAYSAGRHQGSEFTVRLPRSQHFSQSPESFATEQNPPASMKNQWRILVVDDHVDSARSLATSLQLEGHTAQAAQSAAAALQLIESYRPDVVLMDIGMPDMDGYEAAKRIRAQFASQVVLIALTGWGKDEDRRRSLECGFDGHMTKPFNRTAFWELLGAAMQSRCSTDDDDRTPQSAAVS